ncbi:MAG: carboxypeptidase-like regulatory domain-containing protein, partial [Paludibacter sp.]
MKITKLIRPASLLFLFFFFSLSAFAQSTTVKGTVKSVSGETLIGVNVMEVGTTNGTITDVSGNYTIKVSAKSKVSFSYLGYLTSIIEVGGKNTINVILEEDTKALEEVIV